MGEQLELFPRHNPRVPALGSVSRAPRSDQTVGMTVTVLQSGSAGNATLVQCGKTAVLIDCGLSIRRLKPRLNELGLEPTDLAAVLVTHEHSDHITGAAALAAKFQTPIYMTQGTYEGGQKALKRNGAKENTRILPMRGWLAFRNGLEVTDDPDSVDLSVDWVPVSHDGRDTVAYAVQASNFRFGVITDLGKITEPVQKMLKSLDAVSLEANHDVKRLKLSSYPPFVIRRILGPRGHLSNKQAAEFIDKHAPRRLRTILLAHISERANEPDIAKREIENVAGHRDVILTEYKEAIDSLNF